MNFLENNIEDTKIVKIDVCHFCQQGNKSVLRCFNKLATCQRDQPTCQKKYCEACLNNQFSVSVEYIIQQDYWKCPFAENICKCADCKMMYPQLQYKQDPFIKRYIELSEQMEPRMQMQQKEGLKVGVFKSAHMQNQDMFQAALEYNASMIQEITNNYNSIPKRELEHFLLILWKNLYTLCIHTEASILNQN